MNKKPKTNAIKAEVTSKFPSLHSAKISGIMSKNTTPSKTPAVRLIIKCNLSLFLKASNPPKKVDTNVRKDKTIACIRLQIISLDNFEVIKLHFAFPFYLDAFDV